MHHAAGKNHRSDALNGSFPIYWLSLLASHSLHLSDKFLNLCLIGMCLPQDLCALEAVCTCVHAHTYIWFHGHRIFLANLKITSVMTKSPARICGWVSITPLPPGETAPHWDPVASQLPGTSSQLDTGPAFLQFFPSGNWWPLKKLRT